MGDDQLIFEIFKMCLGALWPGINDVFAMEDNIQVNRSWPVSEGRDPPNAGLNPLENLEESHWRQIRFNLKQEVVNDRWP